MIYATIFASLRDAIDPQNSNLPRAIDSTQQSNVLQRGLNALFVTLGAISVLVIVIAALRYIISHGDSRVIEQSKNAILYAVVGLIVSISALAIVNFFLARA